MTESKGRRETTEAPSTRIVSDFPCRVKEIEHVWIAMSDGVRLSARIWMPDDAEDIPVPAILEYIPYRKRDHTRAWDDPRHRFWAGHGYVCVRLDIRGTGESEGFITDEYALQEQDDAVEAISWIAAQPWCSGCVGMTGISWGGFNSLQVAARRPPALKAIITHCSTDDRYGDDVHYMGGCVLLDNFFWGSAYLMLMARSGDPLIQGHRWRDQWLARLENQEPVAATIWLAHQRRDAYWKHGSVCENWPAIDCAVYAVGGWNDGYSNAVPRMLANLGSCARGLIGPWGHKYPQDAIPGPSIGFLQHALRWWDHWLKGRDSGLAADPQLTVWMSEFQSPDACMATSKGRFVSEAVWPSPDLDVQTLFLNAEGLAASAGASVTMHHHSPETVGVAAGNWCPYGLGGSSPDLPLDQREDDAVSLVFDGEPLEERLEILGAPEVVLEIAVDRPQAMVVVRLNDVAPSGESMRVTWGVLNLSHVHSHEEPSPMTPGESVSVRLKLNDCAHAFVAGHRIRIAVSTSYFPVVWPAPEAFSLALTGGAASRLRLPVRSTPHGDDPHVVFEEPAMAPPPDMTVLVPASSSRRVERDVASGEQVMRVIEDHGASRLEAIDMECADGACCEFAITRGDPLSARALWHWWSRRRRGDWEVSVGVRMEVRSSADTWHVVSDLEAFEGNRRVFSRSWNHDVPRYHC